MSIIHHLIAYGAGLAVFVATLWALAIAVMGQAPGPRFEQAQAAVASLFIVAATSGAILLTTGGFPKDALHVVYALVAVAIVPLARPFVAHFGGRRSAVLYLTVFGVAGIVTYRLFTTG